MSWIFDNIWLVLFLVWGIPLGFYRSRFRKLVYQTDDWKINIKPVFTKELRALFGNLFPGDEVYRKSRNHYRFYLLVYSLLFCLHKFGPLITAPQ